MLGSIQIEIDLNYKPTLTYGKSVMKKKIIALFLTITTSFTFAAGTSTGQVGMMLVNAYNFLFFSAGTKSGSPVCGNNDQWVVDLSSPTGKSIYALLLYAQGQGKTVFVVGTGACANWGDREDALYITL